MNLYMDKPVCTVHHNPPDCRMRRERATCIQVPNLLTVPALCLPAPLPTQANETKLDHMLNACTCMCDILWSSLCNASLTYKLCT